MPIFEVVALEKFTTETVYRVEAATPEEAERLAKTGKVAYHDYEHTGDGDEWLETVEVVLL